MLSSAPRLIPGPVLDPEKAKELAEIQKLLSLAWHRNKNQHRRSRWWGEFGVLRRGVGRLMAEVEGREAEGVGKRIEFLREEVMPRCWLYVSPPLCPLCPLCDFWICIFVKYPSFHF